MSGPVTRSGRSPEVWPICSRVARMVPARRLASATLREDRPQLRTAGHRDCGQDVPYCAAPGCARVIGRTEPRAGAQDDVLRSSSDTPPLRERLALSRQVESMAMRIRESRRGAGQARGREGSPRCSTRLEEPLSSSTALARVGHCSTRWTSGSGGQESRACRRGCAAPRRTCRRRHSDRARIPRASVGAERPARVGDRTTDFDPPGALVVTLLGLRADDMRQDAPGLRAYARPKNWIVGRWKAANGYNDLLAAVLGIGVEADRLRQAVRRPGQGEHNVLALIDHYQSAT